MKMLADHVLIDPERWTESKLGSIVVPKGNAQQAFSRGTVVSVGPGVFHPSGDRPPIEVEPGERILYFKQSAIPVIIDGREMQVIREQEIIAILEPDEFQKMTDKEGDSTDVAS